MCGGKKNKNRIAANDGALAMFKKGLNRYSMLEADTSKKHSSLLEAQTPFLNIANAMLCGAWACAVASVVFIKNNFSGGKIIQSFNN